MNRTRHVTVAFLVGAAVLTGLSVRFLSGARYTPPPPIEVDAAEVIEEDLGPQLITESVVMESGDTLDEILAEAGLSDPNERFDLVTAFNQAFDVRKLRAGNELLLERWDDTGEIESIAYQVDSDHLLELHRNEGVSIAEVSEIPGHVETTTVCAILQDSLYLTMARTGEQDTLTLRMADIFAYDIDFFRDPQPGDEFCIIVEKKFYENGQPFTYQRILAAQYINAGSTYDAFMVPDDQGKSAYYSSDGKSLQSSFLRAPLSFDARVSSHFSGSRLHPVLGVRRSHLGTDYAAPTGTPVKAVASGRVSFSAYSGGNGNLITIDHDSGYKTYYLHLSKRMVKAGERVSQGQTIGRVGMTGLATGPHLDLRIAKNGKFMDWEKMRAPRTVTLSKAQWESFQPERDRLLAMMNSTTRTYVYSENSGMSVDDLPAEYFIAE